jgi:lambda family phage portal protein
MRSFSEIIDGAIAPFAPGVAHRRAVARVQLQAAKIAGDGIRSYDAAAFDRRTNGWNRSASAIDRENAVARSVLAWAGHDLVRNNKYAAAAVRQLTATIWGDGIMPQAVHPVKRIQQAAQDDWDRWAENSKVDGVGDWYGHGKISVREMIVDGESITFWKPYGGEPNARVIGMEGAQLDMARTFMLSDGGKVVQGVQFNGDGDRVAYWLFDEHPNDVVFGRSLISKPRDAANVDHMFERLRHRQTRGVSWLGAVAMTLRDIGDIEDAKRLQAKVQACLALVVKPPEGQTGSPLGQQATPPGEDADPSQSLGETMRPGMIARLKPGEDATAINPTPSADQVEFIRQQLAAVSANMVPYHLMTGDVSQANYSSLRAAMNGSYSMVDDWQQNEVIPMLCAPAVQRRMAVSAIKRNDPRFLGVKWKFALPVRRMVDPIKDLMGEIMEVRAGLKLISRSLAERGENAEAHLQKIADMNKLIDQLGLVMDVDPRKVTDAGILQVPSGLVFPKGDSTGA